MTGPAGGDTAGLLEASILGAAINPSSGGICQTRDEFMRKKGNFKLKMFFFVINMLDLQTKFAHLKIKF